MVQEGYGYTCPGLSEEATLLRRPIPSHEQHDLIKDIFCDVET